MAEIFPGQAHDEKVILFARKHWLVFLGTLIIILVMLLIPILLLFILYKFIPQLFYGSMVNIWVVLGASYLLVLGSVFLVGFIDYYFDIVILTNKRIVDITQKKLFHRVTDELDLLHIEDVSCKVQGMLQTFFDYGDVEVQTAGASRNFSFNKIPHPRELNQQITKACEKLIGEDKRFDTIRTSEGLKPIQKLPSEGSKISETPKAVSYSKQGELKEGETINLNQISSQDKILIKFNLNKNNLKEVLEFLPSLKSPTINDLADKNYAAVETVVKKSEISRLLPLLKEKGATDIIQSEIKVL